MKRYAWAAWGDVNAFFGLMLDNVAVMIAVRQPASPATADGQFTPEFVLTRMIPGTALGVLLGDLVYTWMAFRLARRTGQHDVTAMPLGLDTPSTFGVAFLVLLPALAEGEQALPGDHDTGDGVRLARRRWWCWCWSASSRWSCAPLGNAVRRLVPRAGLLGSLAAIALALIAFLPLLLDGIAAVPLVGMVVADGHPRHAGGAPRSCRARCPGRWPPCCWAWSSSSAGRWLGEPDRLAAGAAAEPTGVE